MTQYSTEVSLALGALRHKEFPLLSSPLRRNNLTANVINGTRIASVSHRTREQEPRRTMLRCSEATEKKEEEEEEEEGEGGGDCFLSFPRSAQQSIKHTYTRQGES